MKKYLKLPFGTIVIILILCSMFVGCGLKEQTSSNNTQAKNEQVTLKHYLIMNEEGMKISKMPEIVAEFQKKNPNIKVDIQPLVGNTSADEYTKMQDIVIASGEQIDVLYFKDMQTLSVMKSTGGVEPLDELSKKMGIDIKSEYRGVIPFDGKIYSFPSQYSTWVTYINKDLLDKAKLPVPPADWTWDDYREYAKKLTFVEGNNKIYGSYMHTWEWFNSVGAQNKLVNNPYFKEDGTANFDHPVFKTFMKFRYDLENIDMTQIPFIDVKTQKMAYRSVFFSGKVAMMPQGTWMLSDINNRQQYPHKFKTVFATYPRADDDSQINFSNNGGAGCGYGINTNSSFKEETFKYLYFITSLGIDVTKGTLTPWKKGDSEAIVKGLMGSDESLYDIDSLKQILDDPYKRDNDYIYSPSYGAEVSDVYLEECEKYYVGGQELDLTIENLQNRVNEIVTKNKK